MASMAKSGTSSPYTYTITDMGGNQMTVQLTVNSITGNTIVLGGTGGVHSDGMAMLSTLILELQTGLVP